MEETHNKTDRLENILQKINLNSRHEGGFDQLYELLKSEYRLSVGEEGEYIKGNYRHNLEQTIEKQAEDYVFHRNKNSKKKAPAEYEAFIRHFKQDVETELRLICNKKI